MPKPNQTENTTTMPSLCLLKTAYSCVKTAHYPVEYVQKRSSAAPNDRTEQGIQMILATITRMSVTRQLKQPTKHHR